ncbi:MAG: B12-binding domain-containing radical SAM protein [Alphaproteobacteria bacterium]
MKVLLINPGKLSEALEAPPLGLAYIAGAAEHAGHQVDVLDLGVSQPTDLQVALTRAYQVVGITAASYWYYDAVRLASLFKRASPDVVTVLGGPHAAIDPHGSARTDCFDFVVRGEGEHTFAELLAALSGGGAQDKAAYQAIDGLAFYLNGDVLLTTPRGVIEDLDTIPNPAYHLFPMERYKAHAILASRGCPFRCAFCAVNHIWGKKWRSRSPDSVVDEAQHLVDRYGPKEIIIQDDTFNAIVPRAIRLSEQLACRLHRPFWTAQGIRADRMTNDLAVAMSSAGCAAVSVGIESADETVLSLMRKGERIDDIERGVRCLQRHALPVHGQFIIGNAGETRRSVQCSFDFARRVQVEAPRFNMALPYPGTELWEWVCENGRFLERDYRRFSHHSTRPVFETAEFTARDRCQALVAARRLELVSRLRFNVPAKLRRRFASRQRLELSDLWRDGEKLVRGALLRLRGPYS